VKRTKIETRDLFFTLLFPILIGKVGLVFFGLMYAAYPGDGWGYALLGMIALSLTLVARFLWKYRDYDDNGR
jgi:hypothetical protein